VYTVQDKNDPAVSDLKDIDTCYLASRQISRTNRRRGMSHYTTFCLDLVPTEQFVIVENSEPRLDPPLTRDYSLA